MYMYMTYIDVMYSIHSCFWEEKKKYTFSLNAIHVLRVSEHMMCGDVQNFMHQLKFDHHCLLETCSVLTEVKRMKR